MPKAYSYARFSSALQEKGRSLERQSKLASDYATKHDLELVEHYEDLGISAYRGTHVKKGELGAFIDLVKKGAIPKGSQLLVESLDRLSREKVNVALPQFFEILANDVTIVTLMDEQVYTKDNVGDAGRLFMSLGIMLRAHDESVHKAHRQKQSWKLRRAVAAKRKPTRVCPAWLRVSDDMSTFEPIPERVEVVRGIFQSTANGMGSYAVTRELNRRRLEPWGHKRKNRSGARAWQESYISKILANRAVLGEAQFLEVAEGGRGKRKPIGEPIPGYYPAIVSESLFHTAQEARKGRRIAGKGRRGERYSNLLSGILECDYCKAPMWYINKGNSPKGGQYLQCSVANRAGNCSATRWRHSKFEAAFIAHVRQLKAADIVAATGNTQLAAEKQRLQELDGRCTELSHQIQRLVDLDFTDVKEVRQRLERLNAERTACLEERERLSKSLADTEPEQIRRSAEELISLIAIAEGAKDSADAYRMRAAIAGQAKRLIRAVSVRCPPALPRLPVEDIDPMDTSPSFRVIYRNGASQLVNPDIGWDTYDATALRLAAVRAKRT